MSDLNESLALSEELLAFIKQSPSMFHTTQTIKEYLLENGFTYLSRDLLGTFSQAALTLLRAIILQLLPGKLARSTAMPKPHPLMLLIISSLPLLTAILQPTR